MSNNKVYTDKKTTVSSLSKKESNLGAYKKKNLAHPNNKSTLNGDV